MRFYGMKTKKIYLGLIIVSIIIASIIAIYLSLRICNKSVSYKASKPLPRNKIQALLQSNIKYNLKKYKHKANSELLSANSLIDCLNRMNYQNTNLNLSGIEKHIDIEYVRTQQLYGNESKYYLIFIDICIYNNVESAGLALKNYFQAMREDHYKLSSRCNFDICFEESDPLRKGVIQNTFLWKNTFVNYGIINELNVPLPGKKYYMKNDEDRQRYQKMNINFLNEWENSFEQHLLNCNLSTPE